MRTKSCGIYKITNTVNSKIYIGSSIDISNRWARHVGGLRAGNHPNIKLQRGWNKHGETVFTFEILLLCLRKELIEKEQEAIDFYQPWYNICQVAGSHLVEDRNGCYRRVCSDEAKEKLRIANSKPKSPETRAKMVAARALITAEIAAGIRSKVRQSDEARKTRSERLKGVKPEAACLANEGRHHSDETKAKIGFANAGKSPTEEVRKRIADKLTGVPLTEERKASMRGPRKPQSPEQIAKRVAARRATLEAQNRTH